MGQQPNIPLGIEDLPRPEPHPAPSRRWRLGRPGDPGPPGEIPWGGAFGTPGPDTGYALRLLEERPGGAGDTPGLGAVMAARASRLGRAPVAADIEAAEIILGAAPERPSGHGAEAVRRVLEAIDPALLTAPLGELRRRRPGGA